VVRAAHAIRRYSKKQQHSTARMRISSMATIDVCVLTMLANAVLDNRLTDFGEEMLMVAYDSVAYGSLLHIVAYEVP
jgi:hypothetical protein